MERERDITYVAEVFTEITNCLQNCRLGLLFTRPVSILLTQRDRQKDLRQEVYGVRCDYCLHLFTDADIDDNKIDTLDTHGAVMLCRSCYDKAGNTVR